MVGLIDFSASETNAGSWDQGEGLVGVSGLKDWPGCGSTVVAVTCISHCVLCRQQDS